MYLRSLEGCRLAIGSYPSFYYDATNGGGKASIVGDHNGKIKYLRFNPKTFSIPKLDWRTARFLSMPIPPGLSIEMFMDQLEGNLDKESGSIKLDLKARFKFKIWPRFLFPDLFVETSLQSGMVRSCLFKEKGMPIQKDGRTTLVGIAIIQPTGNNFLDSFLRLPNEALAVLKCEFIKAN